MEYSEFLKTVNERIKQGKIFSKVQYLPSSARTKVGWRDYILFVQPTLVTPNIEKIFSPLFSVLLDGSGRILNEKNREEGIGITGVINDLTIEDYIDFARCLKNCGYRFNSKLKTIVKKC
jgi:hypothetical protein